MFDNVLLNHFTGIVVQLPYKVEYVLSAHNVSSAYSLQD